MKEKTLPPPSAASHEMRPPWISTISFAIVKPRPDPFDLLRFERPRAVELVEDPLALLACDAPAAVPHGQNRQIPQVPVALAARPPLRADRDRRAPRGLLERIVEEVRQGLMDERRVGDDRNSFRLPVNSSCIMPC